MRGSNPTLNEGAFRRTAVAGTISDSVFTVNGVIGKTSFLLALLLASAAFMWRTVQVSGAGAVGPFIIGGLILGFLLVIVMCFVPGAAPFLSPVYALAEGVVLGGISSALELQPKYQGLTFLAVSLTIGVFAAMLLAYRSGLIKPTEKFKSIVIGATLGICVTYLLSLGLGLFGIQMPFIHDSGPIGIAFSLFVVSIAALNLILDFEFIEDAAAGMADKKMEWYAAFGLLVTLVWLYIEILRLLAKLRR